MNQDQIRKIELFAREEMHKSNNSFHDWEHILRVRKNALDITKYLNITKIDQNLLEACCLLHDLSYSQNKGNLIFQYLFEAKMTVNLLKQLFKSRLGFISLPDQAVILDAITHHSFSFPYRKLNIHQSPYCQLLQDADTVDLFSKERLIKVNKSRIGKMQKNLINHFFNYCNYQLGYFLNFPQLANMLVQTSIQ